MAVKIRLARRGKKNFAFFHIVVADSRSPRDGRIIEQIGHYNPNTNPATISIDREKALDWLNKGAQPTETARRILSYEGVLLKKHLQGGVAKGAFSQEEADKRWNAWKATKEQKVKSKKQDIFNQDLEARKAAISAEAKVNTERAEVIAKRKAEEAAAKAAEAAAARAEEEAIAAEVATVEAAAEETAKPVAEA
jgi:small subunit ribosomal protein S16